MPPRKKAAAAAAGTDAADATPAPARRSGRNKAPVAADAAADAAPAAAPVSKSKKAPAKAKGKRTRADDEDDADDDEADAKPSQKKKAKAAAVKDDDDADDMAVDDKPEQKKMVTIKKRGRAPVDEHSGMVDTHQVYESDGDIWECMLNQTEIGKNANKFYVIQLLHPIGNTSSCTLFTRWGRVGETGQTQKKGPFSASTAPSEFKKQFKSKTSTEWSARHGMTAKKSKYVWIERAYGDEEEEDEEPQAGSSKGKGKKKEEKEEEKTPDSQLAAPLQDFVRMVFNTDYAAAALSEMQYDASKLPLGKLSKTTILQGFSALKELSEIISNPNGPKASEYTSFQVACQELTGAYYSVIPHAFGRNRPPTISSADMLKRELELVDALGDMEIAQKLIQSSVMKDESGNPVNPLDAHFRSLDLTSMDPIAPSAKEFKTLDKYVQDTHGMTHRHFKVKVQHAFRVERAAETEAWKKAGFNKLKDGERLLLWHGSRATNFAGILKQGLRIAPPEAPVTGYMFGKGVYFADMMSKSANYCYAHLSANTGLLLLCEVASQPYHELYHSDYHAEEGCKKGKKLCTKGVGRTAPLQWQDAGDALDNEVLRGCHMPAGPGEDVKDLPNNAHLQYNEYIVYNTAQIRVRYLLMVNLG